jgi:hypothetical protein
MDDALPSCNERRRGSNAVTILANKSAFAFCPIFPPRRLIGPDERTKFHPDNAST